MSDARTLGFIEAAVLAAVFLVPVIGLSTQGATPDTAPVAATDPALSTDEDAAGADAPAPAPAPQAGRMGPATIDDARLRQAAVAEPQNWLAHGGDFREQRFSRLERINRGTVGELGVAWEFETGTLRGLEASPIVVDGIAYVSGPWSKVWALDAKTGEELWFYDPAVPGERARFACCDVVNRGVAVYHGKVFLGALDGRLIALDAATGREVWSVQTFDPAQPYVITGAPRVAKGLVFIGNGGSELGVRGYVSAYDAQTGAQRWRFYTVPGNPAKPQETPELTRALETWPTAPGSPEWWEMGGGGTVWDSMAYDPDLDLLYVGVGNGAPWSRWMRTGGVGDNLFLSSIVALRPSTGEYVWHYQTTPGDTWDYTATQHMILADLQIGGSLRKVLMQAPKNGFFYVLDRETGELISAENYVAINWATGIDMATGRPIENPEQNFLAENKVIFPAQVGGHNWQPMAFDPATGYVFIPAIDAVALYVPDQNPEFEPGVWNTGLDFAGLARAGEGQPAVLGKGFIKAWDPIAQKLVWSVELPGGWNGGLLATAGGLVFGGGGDGEFAAYDTRSGEKLWSIDLKTGILAPPVTYEIDGEQYLMLAAGWGGAMGLAGAPDPTTAVAKHGTNLGRIFAFRLGGTREVAVLGGGPQAPIAQPEAVTASAEMMERGYNAYHRYCAVCHGFYAWSVGVLPDLRHSSPEVFARYREIVLGGEMASRGMASFADVVNADDVEAIRQYVLKTANDLYESQRAGPAEPPPGGG